jgi:flagellar biosynthesis anti-sigma factor FlgM
MKIETGTIRPELLDVTQKAKTDPVPHGSADGVDERAGASTEHVALSDHVRQLRDLAGELSDVGAVDRERVDALRAELAAGTFSPSVDAIASALFSEVAAENGGF